MSASGGKGSGYNPPRMTLDQFREFANFFRDFLSETPVIKWSIIVAGIGGAVETLHILWLFGVWLYWKLGR